MFYSNFQHPNSVCMSYFKHMRLSLFFAFHMFKGSFTDVATNHKMIKTEILKKLDLKFKGFNSDFEIALKLLKYK